MDSSVSAIRGLKRAALGGGANCGSAESPSARDLAKGLGEDESPQRGKQTAAKPRRAQAEDKVQLFRGPETAQV